MKIVVCIKQVPDTAEVRIDPERGTLIRKGVPAIVNPLDLHALEAALVLRERHGGSVHLLTMGPASAEEALRECLALGADGAWLCTGKRFAGADTWATASTLAAAIRHIGDTDLVICGKQAIDGDTAQVGPEIAVCLGWPLVPYAEEITLERGVGKAAEEGEIGTADCIPGLTSGIPGRSGRGNVKIRSMSETGYSVFRTELPAVVTAVKDLSVPRLPTLPGWAGALEEPVRRIGPGDLGLPPGGTGLAGSPTRVKKIRGVVHAKTTEFLDPGSDETVRRVAEILRAAGTRDRSGSRGKDGGDAGLREDDRSDRGAERAPCVLLSPRVSEAEGKPAGKTGVPPERAPIIAVLGEIGRGGLNEVSFELTAAARRLAEERGGRLVFAVAGCCLEKDLADAELPRAEEYIFIETRSKGFEANLYAEAVAAWVREIRPEILLGPGTLKGRSMMPLLAARLETGLTADCTGLEIDPETGLLLQTRPAFGGNVLATIVCESRRPQMATVRPRVFSADSYGRTKVDTLCREGRPPRVFSLDVIAAGTAGSADTGREAEAWSDNGVMDNPGDAGTAGPAGYPRLIAEESLVSEGTDITDASLVVSGGRGLGGPEGFELLHRAAELSGGALGASRSAVEAGWAEYVRQVGQTGKTVQPAVYFAVGISGAVQHVVGMHDSDVVIAVNRDPEAPIFGAADIGIVADYRSFLLKLIKFLEETAV